MLYQLHYRDRGKIRTVNVSAMSREEAIQKSYHAFNWSFGYWPYQSQLIDCEVV